MPKDEFDFNDPLELNGVALLTKEDTSAVMAECFAEEFMRMGYSRKQVLDLFRDPRYFGPNMVLAKKGESFVSHIIAETFERWGRPIQRPAADDNAPSAEPNIDLDIKLTSPLGNPAPKLNL